MRRISVAAAVVIAALAIAASSASATTTVTITVNTTETAFTSGDGLCSLAEAIAYADGTAESDCSSASPTGMTTIDIPAGTYAIPGTLALTPATLTFGSVVDIVGAGASSTKISGREDFQVVNVASGVNATISGVTIEDGQSGTATIGCAGSGVLETCPAEDGDNGGGIYNAGTLMLSDDTITGNSAAGGVLPRNGVLHLCLSNCPASPGESAGNGGLGGGVYNAFGGTLKIDGSTFTDNAAGPGGNATNGVSGTGTAVSAGQPGGDGGSGGNGGAIANVGSLNISQSTITGNTSGAAGQGGSGSAASNANGDGGNGGAAGDAGGGGGIYDGGTMTIASSTVAGNLTAAGAGAAFGGAGSGSGSAGDNAGGSDGGFGAGIYTNSSAQTSLTNVTIANNVTADDAEGGGLWDEGGGLVQLSFATIAGNVVPWLAGAIGSNGGPVAVKDSVIAGNVSGLGHDCYPPVIVDGGGNVSSADGTCPGTLADPKLGSLADNGGPAQTMALGSGSPAIDLVPASDCTVTTDERGVARPQGAGCDAGAYELAPPDLASTAADATSANTAAITSSITPNFKDTKVTVDYGASSAYGSQTAVKDLGSANSPTAFSAALTGLSPNTSYHAKIIATNADGTSSSSDLTFTTDPVATVALSSGTVSGSVLRLPLTCNTSSAACSGTLKLTSHVTTRGTKVVGVAASAAAKKTKPKPKRTKLETVGSGSYSVQAGKTGTVALSLNGTGRRLLNSRYRVPATLTMTGALQLSRQVVFAYGRIHAKISLAWSHSAHTATPKRVSLSALPAHAAVTVLCRGRGCHFARRRFAVKGRSLKLTSQLAHHPLAARAVLTFEVAAPGDVGQVTEFVVGRAGAPRLLKRCLVPGARAPSVCA